jgi:hypothetical protein
VKTRRYWPVQRPNLKFAQWREELPEALICEPPQIWVLIVRCRRAGLAVVPRDEWNRQEEPSVVSKNAHELTRCGEGISNVLEHLETDYKIELGVIEA